MARKARNRDLNEIDQRIDVQSARARCAPEWLLELVRFVQTGGASALLFELKSARWVWQRGDLFGVTDEGGDALRALGYVVRFGGEWRGPGIQEDGAVSLGPFKVIGSSGG